MIITELKCTWCCNITMYDLCVNVMEQSTQWATPCLKGWWTHCVLWDPSVLCWWTSSCFIDGNISTGSQSPHWFVRQRQREFRRPTDQSHERQLLSTWIINMSCVVCVWDLSDHWTHHRAHNHSVEPAAVFFPKALVFLINGLVWHLLS